ncbi:regulator of Vps4 activity in the MVB pathway-domain-containing protein [Calycina marina]|uniref:Regulator of Vps4 activity in the MVB pathway-domain-containing protein n=1 Tax=Calycina marina TaxID=1763456 RepID=A0A9P7ZCD5_9HELO|nr:regulator of Vps4 activity in the MVB pathway-domain-containing protein [Calycina marina]
MAPSSTLIAKLKVQLKLSIARLRMVQQKDEAVSKQQRRAMSNLLETGKIESAKIRVENIIRSDITTEVHEILELYCELLLARTGLMESPTCDAGLEEAVKSLIYAAPRTDVKELQNVRALLVEKYGKEFALQAQNEPEGNVSDKVLRKLAITSPREELVVGYLEEIARTYGVNWPPKSPGESPDFEDDDDDNPSGEQLQKESEASIGVNEKEKAEQLSRATPPRNFGPSSPLRVNPPSPSTDNLHPRVRVGTLDLKPQKKTETAGKGGTQSKGPVGGTIPDVDELAQRFAALKK